GRATYHRRRHRAVRGARGVVAACGASSSPGSRCFAQSNIRPSVRWSDASSDRLDDAAVDLQRGAVNVRRPAGDEETYGVRDFLALAEPANRDLRNLLAHILIGTGR